MGEAVEKPEAALDHFKAYEHFCKCLLDAFVVVDSNGKVLKCNPLFSQLVGVRTKQILKASSFDDLLTLQVGTQTLTVSHLLQYVSPNRIDEVTGINNDGGRLNLIIGVYPFLENGVSLGSFILIRDVTAETNLQDKYKDKATQSITDSLTGLFNRAYFVDYLKSQVSMLETFPEDAAQRVMSLVMLDIDYFKKINDTYGHQAGDYILKITSDLMKGTFRKTDIVCRYGGEEFLAILPGTDMVGACTAAEKLRLAIEACDFNFEGTKIPVTISSGVAQVLVGIESGEQTIARADTALYLSKEGGRNRVSFHNGTEPITPNRDEILA